MSEFGRTELRGGRSAHLRSVFPAVAVLTVDGCCCCWYFSIYAAPGTKRCWSVRVDRLRWQGDAGFRRANAGLIMRCQRRAFTVCELFLPARRWRLASKCRCRRIFCCRISSMLRRSFNAAAPGRSCDFRPVFHLLDGRSWLGFAADRRTPVWPVKSFAIADRWQHVICSAGLKASPTLGCQVRFICQELRRCQTSMRIATSRSGSAIDGAIPQSGCGMGLRLPTAIDEARRPDCLF